VADVADQLRDALRDRYLIERELGRGGMAVVYLAHDLKHDRLVALKVLHPEVAATLGPERFLREIRTAARLQHPHILSVHDSGEDAGQLWFTMPYVEGECLRNRLERERELPLEDALRIATEAARALEYAHQHGVIHRDIKPENILLAADGSALVADFGIARALGPGGESLTQSGVIVGTPAYMSPEQADGERQIDGRSDVYSLACVTYEMLCGEPPYTGPSARAIIVKLLSDPIPRLGALRQVPPAVESAITRGLAKLPVDRFPNASAFAAALNQSGLTPTAPGGPPSRATRHSTTRARLLAGLAALAVLALFVAIRRVGPSLTLRQTGALGTRDPIVLADFVNRTSDSTLAATLTDAFRVDLGQSDAVRVLDPSQIASTLSLMRRPTEGPLGPALAQEVAQRRGVKAVVTGEVGAAGPGYLLSAAVVSAADGRVLTAVRTTSPDDAHLIAALDELSARLRERIGEPVSRIQSTPPLAQVTTGSLEALRKYSGALRVGWEAGDYERAITLLQEATTIDTGFASGYRLLALAILVDNGARSHRIEAMTRAYLHRDRLPDYERRGVIASYKMAVESDLDQAISIQRTMLEESRATAGNLGAMLRWAGRCEEAESLLNVAIDSFPQTPIWYTNVLSCALQRGRIAEAETTLTRLARAAPRSAYVDRGRARLLVARGEPDSAIAVLAAARGQGISASAQASAAWLQARVSEGLGRIAQAERYLQDYAAISQARDLPGDQLIAAVKLAELTLRYRRNAGRALASVQEALRHLPLDSLPLLDRPYLTLARFYAEAGRRAEARRLLRAYEGAVPEGVRRGQGGPNAAVEAALALAERRFSDAVTAAQDWQRGSSLQPDSRIDFFEEPHCITCGLYELASALEQMGQPDSAVVLYRRLVDAPGYVNLLPEAYAIAPAWHRLAALYESRGMRTEALDAYAHFTTRWRNADPELQPAVREARRRMAALAMSSTSSNPSGTPLGGAAPPG
jgi:serine/threonine protein kinase/tetratricopeptide (TPR) repeat protein